MKTRGRGLTWPLASVSHERLVCIIDRPHHQRPGGKRLGGRVHFGDKPLRSLSTPWAIQSAMAMLVIMGLTPLAEGKTLASAT